MSLAAPSWTSPPCGGGRPPPNYPPVIVTPPFLPPPNSCQPTGHWTTSNGGLTITGGGYAGGAELAQICVPESGYFYFEFTLVSGSASSGDGLGVATTTATVANITSSWTNGAGGGLSTNLFTNGVAHANLNALQVGDTWGIAVDTVNRAINFTQQQARGVGFMADNTWNPPYVSSFEPGNTTYQYSYSGVTQTSMLLTIYFAANSVNQYTLNDGASGFTYVPPPGAAYGWGGVIPNGATYPGWDTSANSSGMAFGINNFVGSANATGGAVSLTGHSSGKQYFEFMPSLDGANNSWIGVGQAGGASGPSGFNSTLYPGLVHVSNPGGNLGHFTNNNIGQCCVDSTNGLLWIRCPVSNNWNNSSSANPATGAGGASLAGASAPYYFYYVTTAAGAGGACAIISNPKYMTYTAPSGFTPGW